MICAIMKYWQKDGWMDGGDLGALEGGMGIFLTRCLYICGLKYNFLFFLFSARRLDRV